MTFARVLHVHFVNYKAVEFEAIPRRLARQIINKTCYKRTFTHLEAVRYRKLGLKGNVFIDISMIKTGVLY